MTPINDQRHPTTPHTEEQERIAQTQHALGLHAPDPLLDAFATRLALATGIPNVYAMVNPFTTTEQQFVGLHIPDNGDLPTVGRSMPWTTASALKSWTAGGLWCCPTSSHPHVSPVTRWSTRSASAPTPVPL